MIFVLLLIADTTVITRVRVDGDEVSVVLKDAKIAAVQKGDVAVPSGARVIAAQGHVLTAGFIEPLSNLGLVAVAMEKDTNDESPPWAVAPAFRASDGFNPHNWWIADAREEGITSAAVAPRADMLAGTGNWLDLSPRLDTRPLAMFGGISRAAARASGGSRGAMWMRLREIIADARFYKANKRAVDDGKARVLSLAVLQLEALQAVLDGSMLLVLQADRASDIEAALELARAEKLRIAIAGGSEAWRVKEALARAKVTVIMQPSKQTPSSFDALYARDDAAALLHAAGVSVVFTASAEPWLGRLRQEAGLAVAYGMPYAAALRAVTLGPAELYRRDAELGSIKEGKRGNVVLWSGDPFELSTVAEHVFIDGIEQSLDTRHKQLVRRYMQSATKP